MNIKKVVRDFKTMAKAIEGNKGSELAAQVANADGHLSLMVTWDEDNAVAPWRVEVKAEDKVGERSHQGFRVGEDPVELLDGLINAAPDWVKA